jgi:hypothetical protein
VRTYFQEWAYGNIEGADKLEIIRRNDRDSAHADQHPRYSGK